MLRSPKDLCIIHNGIPGIPAGRSGSMLAQRQAAWLAGLPSYEPLKCFHRNFSAATKNPFHSAVLKFPLGDRQGGAESQCDFRVRLFVIAGVKTPQVGILKLMPFDKFNAIVYRNILSKCRLHDIRKLIFGQSTKIEIEDGLL